MNSITFGTTEMHKNGDKEPIITRAGILCWP